MKIYPAIDLKGGRCVRLRQGVASDETVYGEDPVAMALRWQGMGAEFLHVVDLDGAFAGRPVHTAIVSQLAGALSIPFEFGGGLRTDADALAVLDAGASRAVLGSRAAADPEAAAALAKSAGPERIAVGIDARDGFVQTAGWTETTRLSAEELAARLASLGVRAFVFTDTATDGMMRGPNLKAVSAVAAALSKAAPDATLVASGGVGSPADVAALASLGLANLEGVIVGKALYEDAAPFAEFVASASNPASST